MSPASKPCPRSPADRRWWWEMHLPASDLNCYDRVLEKERLLSKFVIILVRLHVLQLDLKLVVEYFTQ